MRKAWIFGVVAGLLLVSSVAASAHAFLDHADPRVGSTVHAAPREVSLWFTQEVEPAFCTLTVTDASNQRVEAGKPQVSGNVMRAALQPVPPGTYRVEWRVLSVDTHVTEGAFSFRVGNP